MNIAPNLRSTEDYQAMDAAHHWHPFTDTTELADKGARVIIKAEGAADRQRRQPPPRRHGRPLVC